MGKNCIQQIRSILNSTSGLTIVELLIAATVGITVLGIALSFALSSHRVYQYDQARTALNQNLRVAIDLLSIDVLQAGERVPGTFPAIELIDGDNGAPDQLMLRQNLLDQVLPVCKQVKAGTATNVVFAALAANPPQGCERSSQQNNFNTWQSYRQSQGGEVSVFIYNPATRQGEFFIYSDEKDDASGLHIHRKEGKWQYTYDYGSAMYILQERRYQVQDGLLQLILNGDTSNPLHIVDAIEDFQVRALMQDGSIKTSFTPADSWTALQALEVTLTGRTTVPGQEIRRTFSTRLFPRNILSN